MLDAAGGDLDAVARNVSVVSRHLFIVTAIDPAEALQRSRNEPEAFTHFYRDRYEPMVRYFARRIDDADIALELVAESFAQAFISRRRFRGSTNEEAESWMYRIGERALTRYLRRGKLERRAIERLGIEAPSINAEQRARVEELSILADVRSVLQAEFRGLSVEQQEALGLRIVQDLPYTEVARRLAISEGAARIRVWRGLKALADSLEGNTLLEEIRP